MLLFSLLLACQNEKIQLDDSGTTDSDIENVTDTADTSDTGETTPEGTPVTFELSGEWGGKTLSLTSITFDEVTGDILLGEQTGTIAASSATVTTYLADPTELTENPDVPGTSFAIFVASLHEDDDGDGYPSGFETISGVGSYWLVYWVGEVPPDMAMAGIVEGWNAYNGYDQKIGDLTAIPLATNMVPDDQISMAGSYGQAEDVSTLGMLLYPQANAVQPVQSLIYDGPMNDPWALSLSEAPPSDHLFDAEGTILALEVPLVYQDTDVSGGLSDGDTPLYQVCVASGDYVSLIYLPEITSLDIAISLVGQGIFPGWLGGSFAADGSLTVLTDTELLTLGLCPYVVN